MVYFSIYLCHLWFLSSVFYSFPYIGLLFLFSSVAQLCPTLCDPMNRSTPDLPVHHQLPEFTQTHVHRVSDAIQPSHPLSSPSPPAPNPSQHQSLFHRVNSSREGKFIPKYFILFVAMVNGIVSLISVFSLLVYRNARDFSVLVLYTAILLY